LSGTGNGVATHGRPTRRPLQPPLCDGRHDHDRRIDSRSDKRRPEPAPPLCGGENVIVCNIYNDSTPAVQDGIQNTALPSPAGSMMPSRCCRMTASRLPCGPRPAAERSSAQEQLFGGRKRRYWHPSPQLPCGPAPPATCLSAPLSAPFRRPAGRKRVRDRRHLKPKPLMVALTGKRRRVRSRNPCASARISVPHTQEQ
jgi:hypothetical protein